LTLNNSSSHNAFYVERDITDWYQDGSLWNRIDGTNGYDEMEGLFPGCYFDMSTVVRVPGEGGGSSANAGKRIMIIGINSFYGRRNPSYNGTTVKNEPEKGIYNSLNKNHIVLLPFGLNNYHAHFGTSKFNQAVPSGSTDPVNLGAYERSLINRSILGPAVTTGSTSGTINQQLYSEFGNHLITYDKRISNTLNENYASSPMHLIDQGSFSIGGSSASADVMLQSCLLSEVELYNSMKIASSLEDERDSARFPAFLYNPAIIGWDDFWLRDIASKNTACAWQFKGCATHFSSTQVAIVRPYFLLG